MSLVSRVASPSRSFQTPSAGRWVLQLCDAITAASENKIVSNPISGEVGAAANNRLGSDAAMENMFQTPSAGRWVLQLQEALPQHPPRSHVSNPISGEVGAAASRTAVGFGKVAKTVSNPISGEVGAAAPRRLPLSAGRIGVSNPISGEVGAAACVCCKKPVVLARWQTFQTPSAGRWVLQRGVCLGYLRQVCPVSNPISGEVGAAAARLRLRRRRGR